MYVPIELPRGPSNGNLNVQAFRSAMIRRSLSLAACLLFAIATVHAQSNYAVVRGSILDPQHRPVPGAHVHLTSTETAAQRDVVANATGLYEIAGMQPGA